MTIDCKNCEFSKQPCTCGDGAKLVCLNCANDDSACVCIAPKLFCLNCGNSHNKVCQCKRGAFFCSRCNRAENICVCNQQHGSGYGSGIISKFQCYNCFQHLADCDCDRNQLFCTDCHLRGDRCLCGIADFWCRFCLQPDLYCGCINPAFNCAGCDKSEFDCDCGRNQHHLSWCQNCGEHSLNCECGPCDGGCQRSVANCHCNNFMISRLGFEAAAAEIDYVVYNRHAVFERQFQDWAHRDDLLLDDEFETDPWSKILNSPNTIVGIEFDGSRLTDKQFRQLVEFQRCVESANKIILMDPKMSDRIKSMLPLNNIHLYAPTDSIPWIEFYDDELADLMPVVGLDDDLPDDLD